MVQHMGRVIAIANQKGGTGKTTTTLNLGAALSEAEERVLLVDFDPQAALTLGHGLDPHTLEQTIYDALLDQDLALSEIVIPTENGPDLAPANLDLAGAEVELLNEIGREMFLKEKLKAVQDAYNFVLIDCPPSLGILTINALAAANEVLIPVQVQYFAFKALQHLLNIVNKVKAKANPGLEIAGFLPTMYQTRTIHSREVVGELESTFPDKIFDVVVKKTVKFPDSVVVTQEDFDAPPKPHSILRYDPTSEHAEAYRKLAKEIVR